VKKNINAGLNSTIVVKLKDNIHHYALAKNLCKTFQVIAVKKLFTTVSRRAIKNFTKKAERNDPAYISSDLFSYFSLICPHTIDTKKLLDRIQQDKRVELAYTEWEIPPPYSKMYNDSLYGSRDYFDPAPKGIDAPYAWKQKGGKGKIKFIDIELGWNLEHEAIKAGTLPTTGINFPQFKEHGTAVLGIIMMQDKKGGIGIAPEAEGKLISQCRPCGDINTPDAIMAAIAHLSRGDILLLEIQSIDMRYPEKLWPVEIHKATYEVIRLATALGIIVIETAGNGSINNGRSNNLKMYKDIEGKKRLDTASKDFKDSGAIIVGAASSTLPHARMNYSNYGNRVDCYAWGENIVTTGSYPRSSGMAVNTYTARFGGTSGATAIITGVAIAIQSIMEANYNYRLSPYQMRSILGSDYYNTPSALGRASDKIGVMPDLKKIIDKALPLFGT